MPLSPEGERQEPAPKQRRAGRGPRPTPKGQRPCQRCLLARSRAEDGDGLKASSQRAREEQDGGHPPRKSHANRSNSGGEPR